jgi:hypothetical protein
MKFKYFQIQENKELCILIVKGNRDFFVIYEKIGSKSINILENLDKIIELSYDNFVILLNQTQLGLKIPLLDLELPKSHCIFHQQ